MAGKMVSIGCKLPHGIVLESPSDKTKTVRLAGLNEVTIVGAEYATTEVDQDFWELWYGLNKEFAPCKSGAIFFAKNSNDLVAVAKDHKGLKTGFEPMNPSDKKSGVKTADNKDE